MPSFFYEQTIGEAAIAQIGSGAMLGNMASYAMLGLGLSLMLVILLRRSGRYYQKLKRRAKKAAKPGAIRTQRQIEMGQMFDRASPLLDAPSTVVRWQVEMQDLGRELKAEIDTKMCLLQTLVSRANEAADRLEAASNRAERLGCLEEDPRAQTSDELSSKVLPTASELAAANRSTSANSAPQHCEQVYRMADSGDNAALIANQIGLPLGEIELLLSLRTQTGESP